MKDVLQGFPEVAKVVSLKAHNSGRYIFADAEVRLTLKRLKDAKRLAEGIEQSIRERLPFVGKVTVHYEPETKERLRYAVMLANRDGEISAHFGAAPLLALWDKQEEVGVNLFREIVNNPFAGLEKGKGIRLAEFLVGKEVDILYTKENFSGKGPAYVLPMSRSRQDQPMLQPWTS